MTINPNELHLEAKTMLWLEVTNFCNLQCTHCYNKSGPKEALEPSIGVELYCELLREARELGFLHVQLIGGEPLFYPYIRGLLDCAADLEFEGVEIYSNLTVLPDWLLRTPHRNIKIATSFYSDDPAVHDEVCQTAGAHRRTLASIGKLVEAGFDIRAGFIEMETNKGHFERTRDFLNSIGVKQVGYDAVRQFGRAEGAAEPNMSSLCGKCSSGSLSVDVKGNVSGCIMSKPWSFGSVHQSKLRDLFDSPQRRQFAEALRQDLKGRELFEPQMCDPYYQGQCQPQCQPSCYPSQGCNPCAPMGSNPCNPNGRCGPF